MKSHRQEELGSFQGSTAFSKECLGFRVQGFGFRASCSENRGDTSRRDSLKPVQKKGFVI